MQKRLPPSRVILLSYLLMIGCSGGAARNELAEDGAMAADARADGLQNETQPLVRIANQSSIDFDSVVVNFPEQVEGYGPVSKGTVSEYRSVSRAFRYAPITIFAGENRYQFQPMDYVGETPLAPGRHTYELGISGGHLALTLHVD